MKPTLQRKNAKRILELAKEGKTINEIAREIGAWRTATKHIYDKLYTDGYFQKLVFEKIRFEKLLSSKYKNTLIDALTRSKSIFQKDLNKELKIEKLPADLLQDIRTLESKGLIKVTKDKGSKVLTII